MAADGFKEAFGKEWGCNLVSIVIIVFAIGYGIYWFAAVVEPQNMKFFDDCYRRETRQYTPGLVPDIVIEQAVVTCRREQRRALGLNPN